ncbi:hypothetical protein SO802_032601 [Lithocarpus litseifolius]|uniref:Uncharacterized protein n=1 Tax=Lithocarpus litseifolius TaxID=425828 RepID=A0AAW2BAU2_9ROSI
MSSPLLRARWRVTWEVVIMGTQANVCLRTRSMCVGFVSKQVMYAAINSQSNANSFLKELCHRQLGYFCMGPKKICISNDENTSLRHFHFAVMFCCFSHCPYFRGNFGDINNNFRIMDQDPLEFFESSTYKNE